MLYLDDPIGPIRGFLLYRDHADSGLYYYVRERPRLAMADGAPELVFLKYRRDVTDNPAFDADTKQELGGGFLAFTVDLGADDAELDALRQEAASQAGVGGDVRLTPVQFDKGSCRLTITKDAADAVGSKPDQPRGIDFFEEVYGT